MKKYYLNKLEQNGKEFYVLIADPRVIVKMIPEVNANEEQEYQRPWNEKRVKEIAKYIAGKFKDDDNKKAAGVIPNAPILNIKNTLSINKDSTGDYIELPETEEEIEKCSESVEVIDGQHRIRAFMPEYIDVDFSNDRKYDMVFTLFDRMSENEKREIFMITNEKQVKVPDNLLRVFKKALGLLKADEFVYELVEALGKEDFSPLQNRIKIGAQKVIKGYQESQISKILNKSGTYKLLDARKFDQTTMAKIISNYLSAWERVYNVKFNNPAKDTITKISGLRYIFFIFPACLEILENRKKPATSDEFKNIIELLPPATGVDNVFTNNVTAPAFRGEGGTIPLAQEHALRLKTYEQQYQNDFDISEGI